MSIVHGGYTTYGQPLGVLMLDTVFPRIPGDIGNAFTFDFPVRYLTVKGANPQRVVMEADPALLTPFIEAAEQLVQEGCKVIGTSCGFLAMFQKELAAAISVPVFTSSLMMIPLLETTMAQGKRVGIITARKCNLTEKHLRGVGITDMNIPVIGLEDESEFPSVFSFNGLDMDVEKVREEMRRAGQRMVDEYPEVGAIVLECTNMNPFTKDLQEVTGLPVYDVTHMLRFAVGGVMAKDYFK